MWLLPNALRKRRLAWSNRLALRSFAPDAALHSNKPPLIALSHARQRMWRVTCDGVGHSQPRFQKRPVRLRRQPKRVAGRALQRG